LPASQSHRICSSFDSAEVYTGAPRSTAHLCHRQPIHRPRSNQTPQSQRVQRPQKDIDYLLARIEILSNRCNRITDTLLSTMSILESQKSIEQSQQVNKLTRLAFVYIPLSFISSVFGMNVKEIQTNLPMWVFLGTALGFTFFSVCLVSWQNIKKWASELAARWHLLRDLVSRHGDSVI
jgi:Mg2+ and Co2+ transporter CorA